MRLRTLAEIATIFALVIAVLQYIKIEPNALDEIPEKFRDIASENIEKAEISYDDSEFVGEDNLIFHQFKAAIKIESQISRDSALSKVIDNALNKNNIKLALMAGKEMKGTIAKSHSLNSVVNKAIESDDTKGYAIIAADLIPSTITKRSALTRIVDSYERKLSPQIEPSKLTELQKYKSIFTFAKSPANMDYSAEEAKIFTETWLKERSYSDFLMFKKYFIFADSPADLDMNSENAVKFATDWLENFDEQEFPLYKDAFQFADSPAGMSMYTEDAMKFALNKVLEHRETKTQLTSKSR